MSFNLCWNMLEPIFSKPGSISGLENAQSRLPRPSLASTDACVEAYVIGQKTCEGHVLEEASGARFLPHHLRACEGTPNLQIPSAVSRRQFSAILPFLPIPALLLHVCVWPPTVRTHCPPFMALMVALKLTASGAGSREKSDWANSHCWPQQDEKYSKWTGM